MTLSYSPANLRIPNGTVAPFPCPFARNALLRTTIHDRWHNAIYLTDERWEHILEFHEEMADFRDELLTTLK